MRNRVMLRLTLILAVLACPARAADWTGPAKVEDGQTLVINGQRLRLSAIEAIGGNGYCWDRHYNLRPCAHLSTYHLDSLVSFKQVTCSGDARDADQIPLVRCSVGDLNVNRQMVRDGWATSEEYRADQDLAKRDRLGVWYRARD